MLAITAVSYQVSLRHISSESDVCLRVQGAGGGGGSSHVGGSTARHCAQGAGCRVQGAGCRVQGAGGSRGGGIVYLRGTVRRVQGKGSRQVG